MKKTTMPSKTAAAAYAGLGLFLLFVTDRRLHVAGFLLPVLLLIGSLISFAYFMETRNWNLGIHLKKPRRVSDIEGASDSITPEANA